MQSAGPSNFVYFLHIPKAAGTSAHMFLTQAAAETGISHSLLWDHLNSGAVNVNGDTRLVGGHFGGFLPLWLKRWPRIVTIVRDPVARILSHIHHVQRHDAHPLHPIAAGLSVGEYCRHPALRNTVDNLQSRHLASLHFSLALLPRPGEVRSLATSQLAFDNALLALDAGAGLCDAACRAIDVIDAVGLAEQFGRSLRLFAAVLGFAGEVAEPRLNTTPEKQKAGTRLTDGDWEALDELTGIDGEVYRHAQSRFRTLCARFGVEDDPYRENRLTA